jgi:hypothetical protein
MNFKIVYSLLFASLLLACKSAITVQHKGLYEEVEPADANELDGFRAVYIFHDDYDKSVWQSPEKNCVQLSTEKANVYSGTYALHVKWDKIIGGCKWIGIGFGWNNWMAKDISSLKQTTCIEMKIKSVKGSFKNLPVAFALEDYSGVQCYYGFRNELSKGMFNDTSWTTVSIPLEKFNFEAKDFDKEKVKQFIIQLEGDGDIYLDEIKFTKQLMTM